MDTGKAERAEAEKIGVAADYVRDIEQRRPFGYAKINHGLWDGMVKVARLRARGRSDREIDRQPWALPGFLESHFYDELESLVRRIPQMRGDVRFAASLFAFPDNDRWDLAPEEPWAKVQAAQDEFLGGTPPTADGVLWKRAVVDRSIVDLVRALRRRHVVLIGPPRLRHFGEFAGLPLFRFVEIDDRRALLERTQIAAALRATHQAEAEPVYLIQAGPLSVWLVLTLLDELPNATFIDLGIVLDLCLLSSTRQRWWTGFFRAEVAASIAAINSSWPNDPRAYADKQTLARSKAAWRGFAEGILPDLAAVAGLPERTSGLGDFDRPDLAAAGPVRYVEDKRVDWRRVHEILDLSRNANQWTNFGPVSLALERALEHVLALPPERAVVACASASVGLTALAGLHAVKLGRPLRWLVCAYTFAVQHTGAFADSIIVDCDDAGVLDLDAAGDIPPDAWDGMVVTNLFGSLTDTERFAKFCSARGKSLIVDSAAALLGPDRAGPGLPAEAISFHHTKPWGVGEGGCVIVDRADAAIVRSALSFGMKGPDLLRKFSGNGKISEISCALILDRIERLPSWSHFYHGQKRRIDKLRRHGGLDLLCQSPANAIAASLPVLASRPIQASELADRPFGLGKYYPSLDPRQRRASRIFSHVVNIPCHSGMAAVPSETIKQLVDELAQAPAPGLMRRLIGRVISRA